MNWPLGKDQWFQISFTSLHVKWLGSFHLLPLPAARGIVLSQMNILPLYCADAKTSDELKELVHLIKPSLWAYRWHRRTKILLYLIRSRLICYRIWNPTFYHILRLTLSGHRLPVFWAHFFTAQTYWMMKESLFRWTVCRRHCPTEALLLLPLSYSHINLPRCFESP